MKSLSSLVSRLSRIALATALASQLTSQNTVVADTNSRLEGNNQPIEWLIEGVARHGVFLNGEPWVMPNAANTSGGPLVKVRVLSVTPAPTASAPYRNGTMKNPLTRDKDSPAGLGYDDRVGSYHFDVNSRFLYGPSGTAGGWLVPGDVLIATESNPTASCPLCLDPARPWTTIASSVMGQNGCPGGIQSCACGPCPTRSAAVLTVIPYSATDPPTDAFRPPYGALPVQRVEMMGRGWLTASQIQWNLLPRLPHVGSAMPPGCLVPFFNKVWVDHVPDWTSSDHVNPSMNMLGYGSDIAEAVSRAALVLLEDYDPALPANGDFRQLAYGFMQVGIDSWGLLQTENGGFRGNGGHRGGRKWPVIFAGLMLGSNAPAPLTYPNPVDPLWLPPSMSGYPNTGGWRRHGQDPDDPRPVPATLTTVVFREDQQFFYLDDPTAQNYTQWAWNGPPWKWAYNRQFGFGADWRGWQHTPPSSWIPEYAFDESYRFGNCPAYVGTALAARIMGGEAMKRWDNPAFFGHIDHWMIREHPASLEDYRLNTVSYGPNHQSPYRDADRIWGDSYAISNWDAYRWQYGQDGMFMRPSGVTFESVTPAWSGTCNGQSVSCASHLRPRLVTQYRPVASGRMLLEIHLPASLTFTNSTPWVQYIFAAGYTAVPQSTPPPPFCYLPDVYFDIGSSTAAFMPLTRPAYGYGIYSMSLPSQASGYTWAVQALVVDTSTSLQCGYMSNALVFTVVNP